MMTIQEVLNEMREWWNPITGPQRIRWAGVIEAAMRENEVEIEQLTLDRDEQAELRAHHFDRANKLSIENKALRKHIERLIVAQEEEAVFGPHNEIPSLNAEIERLKALAVLAYQSGYLRGHEDTVEGCENPFCIYETICADEFIKEQAALAEKEVSGNDD